MIDFAQITPELLVGSCPRSEMDIHQLKLIGVTGVISLQTDADFVKWEIDFAQLEQASFDVDLVIKRIPIIDFDDDDLTEHLESAVNTLYRMLAVGHSIYIHCTAGQERAPSVAAAFLIRHKGMSPGEAEDHLKSLRQCSPKMHVIEAVYSDKQ